MKKFSCMAFMMVVFAAFSAQAVVIHWAVTTYPDANTVTAAQLVYVSSGVPVATGGTITTGDVLGSAAAMAITPLGIGEQNTVDPTTQSAGNYYVVLFYSGMGPNYYLYSSALAFNDTASITSDVFTPATTVFDPSSWTTVPEPGSAALLALGMAALSLRRKKRV